MFIYDTIWSGYRLVDGKCQMLDYDEDNQKWSVLIANIGDESQYNQMFASLTSFLYTANEYSANEGFVSDGDTSSASVEVTSFKIGSQVADPTVE